MSTPLPRDPGLCKSLKLRCPYCGASSLRATGSWLRFADGCTACDYKYEREEGYFTGASWMVNYTVTVLVGIFAGVFLVFRFPNVNSSLIAAALAVVVLSFGAWFMPFSKALWMYVDHKLHPLTDADRLQGISHH